MLQFVSRTANFTVWKDVWEDVREDAREDAWEEETNRHTGREQVFWEEAREDAWKDPEEDAREEAARARLRGASNRRFVLITANFIVWRDVW